MKLIAKLIAKHLRSICDRIKAFATYSKHFQSNNHEVNCDRSDNHTQHYLLPPLNIFLPNDEAIIH